MTIDPVTRTVFKLRRFWVLLTVLTTIVLGYYAAQIGLDAGFDKQLPRRHPYIDTYLDYRDDFGGADRVLIAVSARSGDIFEAEYLRTLKKVTDEAFYLEGVDRSKVSSLFTPDVRYIEIVDGGFSGGNVVPADFDYSAVAVEQVKRNVLKSSAIGRLVANDFSSAMVSVGLLQEDPVSGEAVDPLVVAEQLEQNIRRQYENEVASIEIIGFAKAVGEIAAGARGVLVFLSVTVIFVALLVSRFVQSWKLTLLAIMCSLVAVIWSIGIISMMGYGFDLMSILVPFLVFAIGISHALQILNRINIEVMEHNRSAMESAMRAFRVLLLPGLVALASDTLGFATIYLIDVPIIQDLALMASTGVLVLIVTNLFLLPVFVSCFSFRHDHAGRVAAQRQSLEKLWSKLAVMTTRGPATAALCIAVVLFVIGAYLAQDLRIGDLQEGVPELRSSSRYNRDTAHIVEKYSVGVDILTVIAEAPSNACIDHSVMDYLDDFEQVVANNEHVQSTISTANMMKLVAASYSEGHPKWRELSRNSDALVVAVSPITTATGLRNADCSVMPLTVFLKDHRAESIASVVDDVSGFIEENPHPDVELRLASGNAGVMIAVNEVVAAAQYPMLAWVYGAVTVLCLLLFRCVRSTLCVILPLTVVSVMAYALMAVMEIGLKTSSLPVAALGVGIGVDYGIYIFSQLSRRLKRGEQLTEAYIHTLEQSGSAVLVTGLTLAIAVGTWTLSDLQFQADMGILFSSMLLLNMLGALFVVPALTYFFFPKNR